MNRSNVHAIVLAGGSGTRFWPASRRARPKQLQALVPGVERSLLALTVDRIAPLCPPDRLVVATGEDLLDATRAVLPQLGPHSFLCEPMSRNTAAPIAWATWQIARRDPEAVVMVLPSDHYVDDLDGFRSVLEQALGVAASGLITTVGIEPTRADTGFGYLEVGEAVKAGVHRVVGFEEKPNPSRAAEFLASGRYLWNAGMFFFRAQTMLDAVARRLPALWAGLERIEGARAQGPEYEAACVREVFTGLASISIDHGIMEHERDLRVVPARFGWSDLGSWCSAWELAAHDAQGNASESGAIFIDARRNFVADRIDRAGRVVVLLGVDDLCVVETDDATLIMPRSRAQEVREVVAMVRRDGHEDKV